MDVSAKITGISYKPFLCKSLNIYDITKLKDAIRNEGSFMLKVDDKNQVALSWWVSPKRTRSYPYARIYDTLAFQGKKVTMIPIFKDEGFDGDRDFLQWDTISLMSLLGVFTIISYYSKAEKSLRYENKITAQTFDLEQISNEIKKLLSYQSDALHWNLDQVEKVKELGEKAIFSYKRISEELEVKMHSQEKAQEKIKRMCESREEFISFSRKLAKEAQNREKIINQPKEKLKGSKGTITISNYLGGKYYFTSDEIEVEEKTIYLIEGKHSKSSPIPSLEDIKDGLIKMILFTNLKEVKVDNQQYVPKAVLKLTTNLKFTPQQLTDSQKAILSTLKKESQENKFLVRLDEANLIDVVI